MENRNPDRMAKKHTSGAKARVQSALLVPGINPRPAKRLRVAREQGYVLVAVLFLAVMVLIVLAVAAPKVAADIERDREVELVHRGQQYVRAIKLYYKKFGKYPPNMDALEKTNQIRFLRKRYKDPVTGKDEWHLLHFGENKTPSYGFFGQPIGGVGGSALAGVGPMGGNGLNGASNGASSSASGGLFGNNTTATGTDPNAGTATGTTGTAGTTGTTGTGTDAGTGTTSGTGTDGGSGSTSGTGSGSGSGSSGFGTAGNASGGNNGLTIGGLGIIGVESTSPKLAILEWKKKKHFNEWEFWYDPNADRMMISNNIGAIGQPAGSGAGGSTAGTGTDTTTGGAASTGGGSGGSGGTGGTTTTVPPPQQQ